MIAPGFHTDPDVNERAGSPRRPASALLRKMGLARARPPAPSQFPSLEIEMDARAAEREHAEHAVDPGRIAVGRGVQHKSLHGVPAFATERHVTELVPQQVGLTGRVLDDLLALPG